MSKFKKKGGGELPPISTASLPDIVFMLLFFFMVATVLRKNNLKVDNILPPANQTEKLDKTKTVYIYVGKPKPEFKGRGTEANIQIGDKFVSIPELKSAIFEEINKLRDELRSKVVVALKVDQGANTGIVNDVKKELREANLPKIIYITTNGESVQ
jgi:biopolymer transport protein ExbD